MSDKGAEALDAILAGQPARGARALATRLLDYGMLEPVAATADTPVTFVIPVRNGGPALAALVSALIDFGQVIVVDDDSSDSSTERARDAGATVIANEGLRGPGGARNTGWRLAETEFVAFIDADCLPDSDWARPLAALLAADPGLALAAPRVQGSPPLDMGPAAGLVGPGRRISFVPSAALVARREALEKLNGFDEELRFGEDVDLVWRAVAAGWSVRYAPEVQVRHPARSTLRGRARQQFDYGTSAGPLERRHPGCAAPLRLSGAVAPIKLLRPGGPPRRDVLPLVMENQLTSIEHLSRAVSRDLLPLSILAATRSRHARRVVLAAVAVDLIIGRPNPATRLIDNAAYCAGLWRGAVDQRSIQALLPRWRLRR